MDCTWVSSGSWSMSQNCTPHSAKQSGLPENCSTFDTPWNFWSATMAPLCSHTGLVGPVSKRRWQLSWMNCYYGQNLGSLIWTKHEMPNEWKHLRSHPERVHPIQSAVKVMFIVPYGIDGVILCHAVPPRQMVNTDYCMFLQHHLCPVLRRKWPLVVQNSIILRDNAESHTAAAVMDLLCCWQWEILEHPPYSPDMSPCNHNLFTEVKESLRGTRYNTRDEPIHAIGRSIWDINKDGCTDGVRCLPNLWQRWKIRGRLY